MQQTELNFVPVTELRKDTPQEFASVAYGGGGIISDPRYAKQRAYSQVEAGKKSLRERQARWLAKNPQKIRYQTDAEYRERMKDAARKYKAKVRASKPIRYSIKKLAKCFIRESKDVARFDEVNHWGNHPEVMRWRYCRIAKNQFAKWKSDPQKKIKRAMRTRLWKVLRLQLQNKRGRKTFSFIGCSPPELIDRIASQFELGMTWENFGTVWEIDHKRPCASFDLSNPAEVGKCFHFSNLLPLPKPENRQKSSWHKNTHHTHRLHYEKAA